MRINVLGTYVDGSQGATPTRPMAQPVRVPQRNDVVIRACVYNTNGAPVNLRKNGVTATLSVKDNPDPNLPARIKVTGTVPAGLPGHMVDFTITSQSTKTMRAGTYYYDVLVVGLADSGLRDEVIPTSLFQLLPSTAT